MTYYLAQPANGGTKTIPVDGADYHAHRHWKEDGLGTGSMTLERVADGQLVARALYDGHTRSVQLETLAGPVTRELAEELLRVADEQLA